jgi:hypothetical protein
MKNNRIWIYIGIALLLFAAVFQAGKWFGAMHADQKSLQNDFNNHRTETHTRLSALETDRVVREQRWGWAMRVLALGKKIPLIHWICN